jgi:putative alpha-1,2-mannosidase
LESSDPTNVTYPYGSINIDLLRREVTGYNKERQDFIIGPNPAPSFASYFCARFSESFEDWGTASNGDGRIFARHPQRDGPQTSAYVRFASSVRTVEVRIGVSFISVEQARQNLDAEIPDGNTIANTATVVRKAWAEKLDRIKIQGATDDALTVFYTAVFHTLQVLLSAWLRLHHDVEPL